ncbi:hypothetical protein [Mobiluncus mulieris]|uniref:hypothetical protein n=1 Tax=Mobiluncus mulieris TaxID=2052 RepID=UPI0020165510|nr:hypothetical protein [Mobiluncus mulieris]
MTPEEIEQRAQRRAQFLLDSRKIMQRSQEILPQLETEEPSFQLISNDFKLLSDFFQRMIDTQQQLLDINLMLTTSVLNAHKNTSSSVDGDDCTSDSTGEETPTSGESRCEHCGKPNQAALTAADTPAAPRDPQPTTIPESQVA